MKPHPRIRKTIKWGGAAVTVLLVVVWIGSGWWLVKWTWFTEGWLAAGRVNMWEDRRSAIPRWRIMPLWRGPSWDWRIGSLGVPLWVPTLAVSGSSAIAWRLDTLARRRAKGGLNLCPKCNYDRTGLASKDAKCPECGATPANG